MQSFMLIVLAAIFGALAWKGLWVRSKRSGIVFLGAVCAAIAAALVALVIGDSVQDDWRDWAGGDRRWAANRFIRTLFVMAFMVLAGYWTWVIYKRRRCE